MQTMKTKELIQQYVTAHADNRWMNAIELEALLTEFAEKLIALQSKSREERFREYLQSSSAERRKFDLGFLDETRKEALAVLTDLGYECKLPQEPASEDFEQEWKRYCDSKGGGAATMNVKDVAKHFAQWQKDESDDVIHLEKWNDRVFMSTMIENHECIRVPTPSNR